MSVTQRKRLTHRNHVRGQQALRGAPAITRLMEYTPTVLPSGLESLEHYACYEMGRKHLSPTGCLRLFGREAHVGEEWADSEVTLYESLDGLEARRDGQCLAILRDYRTFKQIVCCPWDSRLVLPEAFYFEPYVSLGRP